MTRVERRRQKRVAEFVEGATRLGTAIDLWTAVFAAGSPARPALHQARDRREHDGRSMPGVAGHGPHRTIAERGDGAELGARVRRSPAELTVVDESAGVQGSGCRAFVRSRS
jgi:hypothetical protein